jgi:predicted lipoprotein with Yx(FWY)xxD motif
VSGPSRGCVRSFPRIARVSANAPAVVAVLLLLAALAGCGGGGGGSSSSASTTAKTTGTETLPAPEPPPNAEEGTVFVSLGSAAGLGQVLVDSEGHTLYAFSSDAGAASTCEAACAEAWPPLLDEAGEPQPSNGTSAARLGTITRPDGSHQVTYAGHPLYAFGGDKSPGEANGNGSTAFGGTWTALKGSGQAAG